MLNALLPKTADNAFRGYKAALWIFGLIVLWKAAIAAGVTFNGHEAAVHADGVPIDAWPAAASHAFLAIEAAWGLGSFLLCAISAVVLFRYRSLVAFMCVVLLVEHVLRRVIFYVMPIPHVGAPPAIWINVALAALLVVALALSLLRRRGA